MPEAEIIEAGSEVVREGSPYEQGERTEGILIIVLGVTSDLLTIHIEHEAALVGQDA